MLKITLWNNKKQTHVVRWNKDYFIIYENEHWQWRKQQQQQKNESLRKKLKNKTYFVCDIKGQANKKLGG